MISRKIQSTHSSELFNFPAGFEILLFLPFLMISLSCRSDGNFLRDNRENSFILMAKVFNGQSRSCPGVTVSLLNQEGKIRAATTDITGKALFPDLPYDTYRAVMNKEGYETISFDFDFNRPDQALYGRIFSADMLLKHCGEAMEKEDWLKAQEWLYRARTLGTEPDLTLFYESLLFWKMGEPQRAADLLEERKKEGNIPKEMEQFLIDLYEYDLGGDS